MLPPSRGSFLGAGPISSHGIRISECSLHTRITAGHCDCVVYFRDGFLISSLAEICLSDPEVRPGKI